MSNDYPDWLRIRPIQQWPRELTKGRSRSPFSANWSSTAEQLRTELRHLGTRNEPAAMVMQIAITDEDLRLDGRLRSGRTPDHPGVIIEIESRHGVLSYPCDTYDRWRDNVRAIVLTLEKLRAIDRYGVNASGQQYTGWAQLPAGGSPDAHSLAAVMAERTIRQYAGDRDGSMELERAYTRARRETHPDTHNDQREGWDTVEAAADILRAAGELS